MCPTPAVAAIRDPVATRAAVTTVMPAFCATNGARMFVVRKAAEVPIIRPPTLVAKLPPVPRR